jgi:hypothetical protein
LTLQVSNTQLVLAFRHLSYICHGRCPFRPSPTPSNISFFVALRLELFNFLSSCWLSAASCIFAISVAVVHSGPQPHQTYLFSWLWIPHFSHYIISGLSRAIFGHSRINSLHRFRSFSHHFQPFPHLPLSPCPANTILFLTPTSHPRNRPALSHPHEPP